MKIFLFQTNNKNLFFQIRKDGLHRYSEYMVNVIFFLESGIETKRIQDRVLVGRGITSRRGEQDNRYWFFTSAERATASLPKFNLTTRASG